MMSSSAPPAAGPVPKVCRATRGNLGRVIRGAELTEAQAIAIYAAGGDVVVCGGRTKQNSGLANRIAAAYGPYIQEKPHQNRGPYALPHFQPDPRPADGHVFYETDHRKAAINP